MTIDYILRLAKDYESCTHTANMERFILQDGLESAIQDFLRDWVKTIPEEKKRLLGDRIMRPAYYIENKRLELEYVWLNTNEVCVKSSHEDDTEIYISISPTHILIRDKEFGMREVAFPTLWGEST
jgi:hypothetical protein